MNKYEGDEDDDVDDDDDDEVSYGNAVFMLSFFSFNISCLNKYNIIFRRKKLFNNVVIVLRTLSC